MFSVNSNLPWIVTSRLRDMLDLAQEMFGPRDEAWTITGVEVVGKRAMTWFSNVSRREIAVYLSEWASRNLPEMCASLSHEVVHVLSPDPGGVCNLEEGLACYFSNYYMKRNFNRPILRPIWPSYKESYELVAPRLDEDAKCIRRLRNVPRAFSDIPKDALAVEFPALAVTDVEFLLTKFKDPFKGCNWWPGTLPRLNG
jgi:hypothetical protein